nr:phage major tail tube protein [uncultured Cohaesibacter sp.]
MTDYRRYGQSVQSDVYLEDNSLIGIAKSFQLPAIKWKTVSIETLGQVAVYEPPTRVLEALSGSFTMSFFEPDLMAAFFNPTKSQKLQFHQYVDLNNEDGYDAERSFTRISILTLRVTSYEHQEVSLGENEDIPLEFSCSRLVQRIHDSDQTLLEVDVFNNRAGNSSGDFWT